MSTCAPGVEGVRARPSLKEIALLLVPRLRASSTTGAFLDGVVVGSLALMAVVTVFLARAAIVDVPTALLAAGSAFLLLRFRLNSAWLVLAGALIGLAVTWVCQ